MGHALSPQSPEFFQLYLHTLPIMCSFRPNTIFAVYTDDEGPRKTVGPGYDMEKSLYGIGLGILPDCLKI